MQAMNPSTTALIAEDRGVVIPAIEAAYAEFQTCIAEAFRLRDEAERLRLAFEACDLAEDEANQRVCRARVVLMSEVVEASGEPLPESNEWFLSVGPFWRGRSGHLLYAIVPSMQEGQVEDFLHFGSEQFPMYSSLAIIDLTSTEAR